MALLRGINVGGTNIIRMAALRDCFEALGFGDVATHIQSGNVIFRTAAGDASLTRRIEQALSQTFAYSGHVILRSRTQMRRIVAGAPDGFGRAPSQYRYDVIFLKAPLRAAAAMTSVRTRDGVDRAAAGTGVIYFSRLISRATQSHLPRLASTPVYKEMTVRNWNTTTALLALMD